VPSLFHCSATSPNPYERTKNIQFRWTQQHKNSFEQIKQMLTSEATMAYFDPYKETELTTDASLVGLSAILSQERQDKTIAKS